MNDASKLILNCLDDFGDCVRQCVARCRFGESNDNVAQLSEPIANHWLPHKFNRHRPLDSIFKLILVCASTALIWAPALTSGQQTALDFEASPISYSQPETENALSQLQDAIDSGRTELQYDDDSGYLPDVLKRLDICLLYTSPSPRDRG